MMPGRLAMMPRRMRAHCGRLLGRIGRAAAALLLAAVLPAAALADDDLPGRVGRIADVAGILYLSPADRPSEWAEIGLNYPVTSGDNLWVSGDGRAEVDYGGGQFRLTGDTSLHVSRLDDSALALFVAQGRVIVRVRVLDPGDAARIDAPNTQVQLTRIGLYRIDVTPDRQASIVTVREGEVLVALAGGAQQALPGQTVTITGQDPVVADVGNGIGHDGFDTWSANRDRYYEQGGSSDYVPREMVGSPDLDRYGTWQQYPDYGAVWFPNSVAPDWAPYSDGYWTSVGPWGYTWVDFAPWGYAPFHYGRWASFGGRWGWCPGRHGARPAWAPALVAWHGGAGWGVSARFGSPVYGWVPLGWRDPYLPSWRGCSARCWSHFNQPYGVNARERPRVPPSTYANSRVPGAITAVSGATLAGGRPVAANRVRVPAELAAAAPVLDAAPPVTPGRGHRPSVTPGGALPPPASAFYPSGRSRAVEADRRPGGTTRARSITPAADVPAGASAAPAAHTSPGIPAASAQGARVRAAPYPVLPNAAAGPAPAPMLHSPGGDLAGGRVVEAPPVRRDATPGSPRPIGVPGPATVPPAPAYGVGAGVAAPTVRSAPALRAEQAVPPAAPQGGQVAPPAAGHPAGRPAAGPQDAPQGGQGVPPAPSGQAGGAMNR